MTLVDQAERMRAMAAELGWDQEHDHWRGLLFRREPAPGRRGTAGEPWAPDTIGDEFEKACARAGWPTTRTPHHARHFVASRLLHEGLSSKAACAVLGHKTVRTFGDVRPRPARSGLRQAHQRRGVGARVSRIGITSGINPRGLSLQTLGAKRESGINRPQRQGFTDPWAHHLPDRPTMVEMRGLEPLASAMRTRRSSS